jgi:hypothetical protein
MKADVYYFERMGDYGLEWVIDVTRPGSDGEVLARYLYPHTDLLGVQFLDYMDAIMNAVDYHPEYATIAREEINARILFAN